MCVPSDGLPRGLVRVDSFQAECWGCIIDVMISLWFLLNMYCTVYVEVTGEGSCSQKEEDSQGDSGSDDKGPAPNAPTIAGTPKKKGPVSQTRLYERG